jgi:hypothetical protein
VLLAETGLLDVCGFTSHWGYEDLFRQRYPKVRFRPVYLFTKLPCIWDRCMAWTRRHGTLLEKLAALGNGRKPKPGVGHGICHNAVHLRRTSM